MLAVAEHYQYAFAGGSGEGSTREEILDNIQYTDSDLIQDDNNVIVIRVNSQEAMTTIGCTSLWCFSRPHEIHQWYNYAPNGFVYVIFDLDKSYEESIFMMVYLPDTGTVYVSTNVTLAEVGIDMDDSAYLKSIGVDIEKVWEDSQNEEKGEREEYPEDDEEEYEKNLAAEQKIVSLPKFSELIKEHLRKHLMVESEIRLKFNIVLPEDIAAIQSVFHKNGFKLYVVGGAVRDALLGKKPKDFDLATDAHPDKVESILNKAGFKTVPKGKAFGVVSVLTGGEEYEIATFRNDRYKDDDLEGFKKYLKGLNNGKYEEFINKFSK